MSIFGLRKKRLPRKDVLYISTVRNINMLCICTRCSLKFSTTICHSPEINGLY